MWGNKGVNSQLWPGPSPAPSHDQAPHLCCLKGLGSSLPPSLHPTCPARHMPPLPCRVVPPQVHIPNQCEVGGMRLAPRDEDDLPEASRPRDVEQLKKDPNSCFFEGQPRAHGARWAPAYDPKCSLCSCQVMGIGADRREQGMRAWAVQGREHFYPQPLSEDPVSGLLPWPWPLSRAGATGMPCPLPLGGQEPTTAAALRELLLSFRSRSPGLGGAESDASCTPLCCPQKRTVICDPILCQPLNCTRQVHPDDRCCPVCEGTRGGRGQQEPCLAPGRCPAALPLGQAKL